MLVNLTIPSPVETTMRKPAKKQNKLNPIKRFLMILGPGFITGASDDDPSSIGTYAVAGASFGFATLWTALITFPLQAAVQFTCARIAMVTGRGLAGVLRKYVMSSFCFMLKMPALAQRPKLKELSRNSQAER